MALKGRRKWTLAYRRWRASSVLLALVLMTLLGYQVHDRYQKVARSKAEVSNLEEANRSLRNRIGTLEQKYELAASTIDNLQQSVEQDQATIADLRASLMFYQNLLGQRDDLGGIKVRDVQLKPVNDSHAWHFSVAVTRQDDSEEELNAHLTVAVEGSADGQWQTLAWKDIATADDATDGIAFAFRYFAQIKGTLDLPRGFVPQKIILTVTPEQGDAVTQSVDWANTLVYTGEGRPLAFAWDEPAADAGS